MTKADWLEVKQRLNAAFAEKFPGKTTSTYRQFIIDNWPGPASTRPEIEALNRLLNNPCAFITKPKNLDFILSLSMILSPTGAMAIPLENFLGAKLANILVPEKDVGELPESDSTQLSATPMSEAPRKIDTVPQPRSKPKDTRCNTVIKAFREGTKGRSPAFPGISRATGDELVVKKL